MNTPWRPWAYLGPVAALIIVSGVAASAESTGLDLRIFSDKDRLAWVLPPAPVPHALTTRRVQLQHSPDLLVWTSEGSEITGSPDGVGQSALDVLSPGAMRFYRLVINDTPDYLASGGAAILGYQTALAERLAANVGVSPSNFATAYFPGALLDGISFNVAETDYYEEWNTDPAVWNALPAHASDPRLNDFRLDPASLEKLHANGFVVDEARGATSFTDLYYRIWTDDLPVYVTSDSILHAWHRTWITLLEEIEELALRPRLEALIFSLSQQLHTTHHPEALRLARRDAQAFLLPAIELIDLINQTLDDPPEALLGPLALKAFNASASSDETLFGSTREINWTQFEPRAHYTHSEALQGYFRTMSWLSLIDLRIDARADNRALRELGTAVVVTLALRDAGLMDDWQEIDRILTTFLGQADSLTPPQLLEILQSEKLAHLSAFTSQTSLETLLARIQSGQAGMQAISAHPIAAPVGEEKRVLPRSFTFFSQRFTPESWALSRMVFDQLWRANPDPSGPPLRRIHRRLPSALDLAFSVLGNNTPAALLSQRMTTTDGVPYRDGHDFARELVSIRQVIDALPAAAWEDTLYLRQLAALRTLSAPLPPTVPEAMRTEAWNWKTVQTQLAGWTELRHDNLLYAKQSYTPSILCLYPAGYVEPRPAFYTAMQQLVDFAHTTLAALPLTGTVPGRPTESDPPIPVDVAARQTSWLQHLTGMSATLGTLAEIAAYEVALTPFTDVQTTFLEGLVQSVGDYAPNLRTYTGWYPNLFLKSVFAGNFDLHPSEIWDPLVTDVHADAPDPIITQDPGAVLYNATGNITLLLVAIDVNGQRRLHGGPSFTYYEFTGPYDQKRITDETWKTRVRDQAQPAHPEWTSSWLVPGPLAVPSEAR